ncbi:MAG: thymidine phosphorylase [Myxococcota bacterium]|nr:thymidine phosphorylase [Myxococcota bacterium]
MIQRWLEERREGVEQDEAAIRGFVEAVVDERATRAQAAAWLAFVACRGMSDAETVHLTRAMTESGMTLSWEGLEGPFVDKHSTGGVGDKVSLVLAPVWAALGYKVPMISGRGLGITGGTLDKLEAIAGYRTDLEPAELRGVLETAGCFISGQTGELAPADRILYALRNETGTVPSIALITASILSKKMAEGLDRLVLDVKCGTGAFMKTREGAQGLADSLVRVGKGYGVDTQAHITDMSEPLGDAVGNALEVLESIDTLKGGGPKRLRDLVCELSGRPEEAAAVLDDGRAYVAWEEMVRAQGGDLDVPLLGAGCSERVIESQRSGTVVRCDAEGVGRAAFVLGAGREAAADPVHPGVGVIVHAHVGDAVEVGQPLFTVVHAERGLERAMEELAGAISLGGDS